jgi:succinate dehydrogenase/fumarate reductase-like Fe-S protein
MHEKVESWIHTSQTFDPQAEEERMDNALAEEIYELERCIECGCCVAGCGTANMRADFVGAVAMNRIARFMMDPRDQRSEGAYFEIVGTDEGIFGCMGLLHLWVHGSPWLRRCVPQADSTARPTWHPPSQDGLERHQAPVSVG